MLRLLFCFGTFLLITYTLKHEIFYNKYINVLEEKNFPMLLLKMCIGECMKLGGCLSVNFDLFHLQCYLLSTSHLNTSLEENNNMAYIYVNKSDLPCNRKCRHFETCINLKNENDICIKTECSSTPPEVSSSTLERSYDPPYLIFTCELGKRMVGTRSSTSCVPGEPWSTIDIHCQHAPQGQFGRYFVLAFPEAYSSVKEIQILIVSMAIGSINVASDEAGVDQEIEISPERGLSLNIPASLMKAGSNIGDNTVLLQSTTDIAVFCVILGSSGTGDGYMAIPINSLQEKYFFSANYANLLSIVSFHNGSDISIVSTAGSTITLNSLGLSGSTVRLDARQLLQIKCESWTMGYVSSMKPFMLLHGSHGDQGFSKYKTSYTDTVFYNDGSLFIIPYLYNNTRSVVFCNTPGPRSAYSDRSVTYDPNYLYILVQSTASYIKVDFNTSCHYIGHGFSVTIPPVSSYASYCRFLTPYQSNFTHHAVVLIQTIYEEAVHFHIIDDKTSINSTKREVVTVDGVSHSVLYFTILPGQYQVYHENQQVTLGVIIYGFNFTSGTAYGFPACFSFNETMI